MKELKKTVETNEIKIDKLEKKNKELKEAAKRKRKQLELISEANAEKNNFQDLMRIFLMNENENLKTAEEKAREEKYDSDMIETARKLKEAFEFNLLEVDRSELLQLSYQQGLDVLAKSDEKYSVKSSEQKVENATENIENVEEKQSKIEEHLAVVASDEELREIEKNIFNLSDEIAVLREVNQRLKRELDLLISEKKKTQTVEKLTAENEKIKDEIDSLKSEKSTFDFSKMKQELDEVSNTSEKDLKRFEESAISYDLEDENEKSESKASSTAAETVNERLKNRKIEDEEEHVQ
jgi:hypothetical protein